MIGSSPKFGNQVLPETLPRETHRVRVNLSFSDEEVQYLERRAEAAGLRLATYLRSLVLKRSGNDAMRVRKMARFASEYERAVERNAAAGRQRRVSSALKLLATQPPRDPSKPYYRSNEARVFLQALPRDVAPRAEALMQKLKRQPTVEEYAQAGVELG